MLLKYVKGKYWRQLGYKEHKLLKNLMKRSQCQHSPGYFVFWLQKPHGIAPHLIPSVAKLKPICAHDISQQLRFLHWGRKRATVDKKVNSLEQTESHFWKYSQSTFPRSQQPNSRQRYGTSLATSIFCCKWKKKERNWWHYALIHIALSIANLSIM